MSADEMRMSDREFKLATEEEHKRIVMAWPLMATWQMALAISLYLYFVLKLGPRFMANREPYRLKGVMIVYNLVQVLLSVYVIYITLSENAFAYMFHGHCPDIATTMMLKTGNWLYLFNKYTELFDTVCFVLRKKQKQVTFLHVYHHASMVFVVWFTTVSRPADPRGAMTACLNSGVHVIMYSYYALAAMGPQYQKYLWWKKYLTKIQIVQFVLIISYMIAMIVFDCEVSHKLSAFYATYTLVFVLLFANFYRKSYKNVKNIVKDSHDN